MAGQVPGHAIVHAQRLTHRCRRPGWADGVHATGYLPPMKLVLLLVVLLAVIGAVAFVRTGRGSRGTRRAVDDRHRPMTEWADEREVDTPPSGASVEQEAEPENPSRP